MVIRFPVRGSKTTRATGRPPTRDLTRAAHCDTRLRLRVLQRVPAPEAIDSVYEANGRCRMTAAPARQVTGSTEGQGER
jgi:hypothetical protein